jgi:hypothetical protein
VLAVALSSFTKCYEDGGFYWKDADDNEILLKPHVHMIIGDIAGVNEMVGHYNTAAMLTVLSRTASVTMRNCCPSHLCAIKSNGKIYRNVRMLLTYSRCIMTKVL